MDDTADPTLHERDWPGQLEAAARAGLPWGFLAFFLGYGSYYLCARVVGSVVSARLAGFDVAHPPDLGPLLLLAFAPNLLLGAFLLALSRWRGEGPRRDYGLVPTLRDVRVGLYCGALALLGGLVVGLVVTATSPPDAAAHSAVARISQLSGGQTGRLGLFALFALVGAPLTEELLVRGALWGALETYRVPRYAILVLTAMIFAFLHEEPFRSPVLFVGGLAIGAARMVTGRIGASMVAHAANNLLPALLIFFGVSQ